MMGVDRFYLYLKWVGFTLYNRCITCILDTNLQNIFLCVSVLRNIDARGVPGIPWLVNTQKLFEWANEVRIDPNNPEYSDLMEFIMVSYGKYQYFKYIVFPKLDFFLLLHHLLYIFLGKRSHIKVTLRIDTVFNQATVL